MALHEKFERLREFAPDVAVVPECASPDILRRKAPGFHYADVEWRPGAEQNKGLGVFAFGGTRIRLHETWTPQYPIFLPIEVRGGVSCQLLAVWAFNRRASKLPYVGPNPPTTSDAVAHYASFLRAGRGIVAGDFNASVYWDTSGKYASFARLDEQLRELGLTSAYHARSGEVLGAETRATFWQNRDGQSHGYHIDYAYVPTDLLPNVTSLSVGKHDDWRPHSDHAPLVIDIDMSTAPALSIATGTAGASRA
jgi:exodeoxyribonuclease III